MKIHLIREDQEGIENFQHVKVSPNSVDLSSVSDNECEVILATDVLDSFTSNSLGQLVGALLKKLRMGGELSIGGTDARLLSKHILNGLMEPAAVSSLVGDLQSITFMPDIQNVLEKSGLRIISTHING